MKDYVAYNHKLFSRWAPIYDGFEIILSSVRKKITQEINPVNKTVLDVATGTGSLAIALSANAKEVVGIDLSSKMLDVAKKKNTELNFYFYQPEQGLHPCYQTRLAELMIWFYKYSNTLK